MKKLLRVIDDGQGASRLSGNGCFPAPKKEDIGKDVILDRRCMTWDGWLGTFADDKSNTKYAFWSKEVG